MTCSSGCKKRRRVRAAEIDKGNEEKKASAVPIIMRLIEKERKKAMSRKMMREKRKRGNEIRRFRFRRNFLKFLST